MTPLILFGKTSLILFGKTPNYPSNITYNGTLELDWGVNNENKMITRQIMIQLLYISLRTKPIKMSRLIYFTGVELTLISMSINIPSISVTTLFFLP